MVEDTGFLPGLSPVCGKPVQVALADVPVCRFRSRAHALLEDQRLEAFHDAFVDVVRRNAVLAAPADEPRESPRHADRLQLRHQDLPLQRERWVDRAGTVTMPASFSAMM